MSFRKEKKFRLTFSDFNQAQKTLLTKGMSKLYDNRIVNSLYFDTADLNMFHESEEGVLPRKKIRIRWYNKSGHTSVEKKISSIEGRYKTVLPFTNPNRVEDLFHHALYDQNYGRITPSLLVSYERSYFALEKTRITFDSKITYQNPRLFDRVKYNDPERVMEIKIGIDHSEEIVDQMFPHPTSRFSKYSRGILLTNAGF